MTNRLMILSKSYNARMLIIVLQDVRPYSGGEEVGGSLIDRSDTFGRRRMDTEGEK